MTIKEIIDQAEDIKIQDDTNGSEAWMAIQVLGVRKNSNLGKEMIACGFHADIYYKGLLYTVFGNLKEKDAKVKFLTEKLTAEGIKVGILDRAL